jgi:hypothetical protein
LLWLYAIATALYALANVVISYRLSIGDGFGSVLALVAGIAQTVGLLVAHATLQEIVLVQVIVMGALLVVLLGWDFMRTQQRPRSIAPISTTLPVQGSNSEPAVSTTS